MLKIEDAAIASEFCVEDGNTHISIKVVLSNNKALYVATLKEAGAECFADALENMAKAIKEKL